MKKLDTKFSLFVALLFFSYWSTPAFGQLKDHFESHEWLYGKVVLTTGDSISGPIVYHPLKDVVQIGSGDGTVSSFSPVNVSHFTVMGVYKDRPQLFRALFWNLGRYNDEFKKPVFFEQVNDGKLILIKRYTGMMTNKSDRVQKESSQNIHYPHFIGTTEELQEDFFALMPDGEILPLHNRKRALLQLFGDKSGQVKRYVRSNRLDYKNSQQLIAIVDYYNSL